MRRDRERQIRLERKRRHRKERRHLLRHAPSPPLDILFVESVPPSTETGKMSAAFLEFARPYLDRLPEDAAFATTRSVLFLACAVWNQVIIEDTNVTVRLRRSAISVDRLKRFGRIRHLLRMVRLAPPPTWSLEEMTMQLSRTTDEDAADIQAVLEGMARRKRMLFADDHRIVVVLSVREEGDDIRVRAYTFIPTVDLQPLEPSLARS